jgi:hypothetical protein
VRQDLCVCTTLREPVDTSTGIIIRYIITPQPSQKNGEMVARHPSVCCVRCGCALGEDKRCDLCEVVYLTDQMLSYERLVTRGKTRYWKQVCGGKGRVPPSLSGQGHHSLRMRTGISICFMPLWPSRSLSWCPCVIV